MSAIDPGFRAAFCVEGLQAFNDAHTRYMALELHSMDEIYEMSLPDFGQLTAFKVTKIFLFNILCCLPLFAQIGGLMYLGHALREFCDNHPKAALGLLVRGVVTALQGGPILIISDIVYSILLKRQISLSQEQ